MTFEFLAIAIPVAALILMMAFGRALQRFTIHAPDQTAVAHSNRMGRDEAIERLGSLNWDLPPDYKFDRDEANERRLDKE